jgi:hypothetical protein
MIDMAAVSGNCPKCGEAWILEGIPFEGYERWLSGELIQRALPDLTINERELLISGLCSKCWDQLFLET